MRLTGLHCLRNMLTLRKQREVRVRKIALLAFLIGAGVLAAQSANSTSGTQSSDLPTITGCLQSSMGSYTLVDETGTIHDLVGGTGKLRHEVGHRIEVAGKPGTRSVDRTLAGGASSVIEKQVFEVKSVKRVADTCN